MNRTFTTSYFWRESVVFKMLMSKVNGKDLFFSSSFTFHNQGVHMKTRLKTIVGDLYIEMIYILITTLEKTTQILTFLSNFVYL